MGLGYVPGALNIMCPENCDSKQHVLIETDYEHSAYVWQVVIGDDHNTTADAIQLPVANFLEEVDDESTFFLQSVAFDLVDELATKIIKDIEESKK